MLDFVIFFHKPLFFFSPVLIKSLVAVLWFLKTLRKEVPLHRLQSGFFGLSRRNVFQIVLGFYKPISPKFYRERHLFPGGEMTSFFISKFIWNFNCFLFKYKVERYIFDFARLWKAVLQSSFPLISQISVSKFSLPIKFKEVTSLAFRSCRHFLKLKSLFCDVSIEGYEIVSIMRSEIEG